MFLFYIKKHPIRIRQKKTTTSFVLFVLAYIIDYAILFASNKIRGVRTMSEEEKIDNSDLLESIAMLEQILEVMPTDIMTLKALFNAYNQTGNIESAFEFLTRIADVSLMNKDTTLSQFVLENITQFEEQYSSEVAAHSARLQALAGDKEPSTSDSTPKPPSTPKRKKKKKSKAEAAIASELALAWRLYEDNQLSQEEYSLILNDLTEISSKDLDIPCSVLHVIFDRKMPIINKIRNYLSNRSGVPNVSLANFSLPKEVASVFPIDISIHDGALPFGFIGNDLMIAVLNPFDSALIDKTETFSGHHCHPYLVAPEEYDKMLEKLKELG